MINRNLLIDGKESSGPLPYQMEERKVDPNQLIQYLKPINEQAVRITKKHGNICIEMSVYRLLASNDLLLDDNEDTL